MMLFEKMKQGIQRLKDILSEEKAALETGAFESIEMIWIQKQQIISEFERLSYDYKKREGNSGKKSLEEVQEIGEGLKDLEIILDKNMKLLNYLIEIKKFVIEGLTLPKEGIVKPINNYTPEGLSQGTKMNQPAVSLNQSL